MSNWVADFLTRNPDLAALPVTKRAKHSLHIRRPDGTIEANFTGAPCHYLDTDNIWKPLDTKLQVIGTEYGAPGLRGRFMDDGTVKIKDSLYSHKSTRIGIYDPQTKAFSAVKTIPLGLVSDDKIIAKSGIWKRVLTLTETGVREEIVIQSKPTNTGAGLDDWLVLETAVTGMSFPDGELDSFELEEFRFPPPSTKDANGNIAPCKRFARTVGNIQYVYTGVPVSWLATAVYPVVIDPDFAGDAANGTIEGTSTTYATARSTSTSFFSTGTYNLDIGQRYNSSTGYYFVWRSYLVFDTSGIPDTSTITQVNLKLVCIADSSTADFDVVIKKQDWSAQNPLSDANREAAFDGCLAATSDDNIWRNTSGMSSNTQYTSGNLATAWINLTGSTYYSLISSEDIANSTPTGYERISLGGQENPDAPYRPVLTVLYSTPLIATIGGLAIASVKTVNGLAIASVKTVNGLAKTT
jgi:hypothetical protein